MSKRKGSQDIKYGSFCAVSHVFSYKTQESEESIRLKVWALSQVLVYLLGYFMSTTLSQLKTSRDKLSASTHITYNAELTAKLQITTVDAAIQKWGEWEAHSSTGPYQL